MLVKIESCGVCATDVKKFTGASKAPHLPFILGHEPEGVIVEVGQDVGPKLARGDRVAVAPVFVCGRCYGCRTGLTYSQGMGMCEDYQVLGYSIDGAFAEYAARLLLVFPVDAQIVVFAPTSRAFVTPTVIPLSLKEPVGLSPSYLT